MAYKQLKYWFDRELLLLLAEKIQGVFPAFDTKTFIHHAEQDLAPLELKDRVAWMADRLHQQLPGPFDHNASLLVAILGPQNEQETGMFHTWYWVMPLAAYVEKYGLDHFESSMYAIETITMRNTGEYAIRHFIETHYEATMARMRQWSCHPNFHVRRLSCEGGRPRLPWAKKLDRFIKDPAPLLPILENLKDDPSRYVQKSVANCLNDILKDNETVGKKIISNWCSSTMPPERQWIVRHAIRNLVKRQDPWALNLH